jgi:hypothetical protein
VTYDSEVAADSPWGYWKTTEASGNLADSSGNSRTMTVTGSPTYAQSGPVGASDAVSWTNVASQHAETTATSNAGAFTHEAWVYLTANPAANVAIQTRATAYNTVGAADGELYIQTDGKVAFHIYIGSSLTIVASAALALNTWHHVIASVGAAGTKLRIDKSTVATNAATSAYTGAGQIIFIRGGGSGYTGTAAVKLARHAYYTAQLSDARTDAHYDAMLAGGGTTINGEAFAVAGTFLSGSALTAIRVDGTAFSSTVTLLDGTAKVALSVDGDPFTVGTTFLDGQVIGAAIAGEPFVVGATFRGGSRLYGTNTTNLLNGRERRGSATVTLDRPTATVPDGVALAAKIDKAIAYPNPVIDNGRPT